MLGNNCEKRLTSHLYVTNASVKLNTFHVFKMQSRKSYREPNLDTLPSEYEKMEFSLGKALKWLKITHYLKYEPTLQNTGRRSEH